MTRRRPTIWLLMVFLIGVSSLPVRAQAGPAKTLKGISALTVLVEDLTDGAKALGLTAETIQTDVELKLRQAGMRVVTPQELHNISGQPWIYVQVSMTNPALVGHVLVQFNQNAMLERSREIVPVSTWSTGTLVTADDAQTIRDKVKDLIDKFLNAWLSVNPKN